MAGRDAILAFLDELLDPGAFDDFGPNGLQVIGSEEVALVATGVTPSLELFERAGAAGAHLLVTHHGLMGSFAPAIVDAPFRRRLQALFEHDITLATYHLPLDAHPEHGNNALLIEALGLERGDPFAPYRGRPIGFVGHAPEGIAAEELLARVETATGRKPLHQGAGPDTIRSVGVVTGGAASNLTDAIDLGLDSYLTGEPAEHVMTQASEAGIHFIAAGHYATETAGVRRLGELLVERFGVRHEFIDLPNPV